MPDITMMQPTSKIERSGSTPPRDSKSEPDGDTSDADFESAYASEAKENAVKSTSAESDSADAPTEAAAPEPAHSEDEPERFPSANDVVVDDAAPVLIQAEDLVSDPDLVANERTLQQSDITTAKTDPEEWAFSQMLTRSIAPETPVEATSEFGTAARASDQKLEIRVLPTNSRLIADQQSEKPTQGPLSTSRSPITPPASEEVETVDVKSIRTAETVSQTAVQMKANSTESQQQKLTVPNQALHPDAEKQPARLMQEGVEETFKYTSEATTRVNSKAAVSFQTPASAVSVAPPQPVTPLTVHKEPLGVDTPLTAVGDIEAPAAWDARAATQTTTLAQTIARPETPGMIGRQMAEVLQRMPDRPVELALNPEELGRVRMSISAGDAGITVSVLAERPETLDLMRRHIDQLAREFQALGYANINFAFNEGQSDQSTHTNDGSGGGNGSEHAAAETAVETAGPIRLAASSGLDLRL